MLFARQSTAFTGKANTKTCTFSIKLMLVATIIVVLRAIGRAHQKY